MRNRSPLARQRHFAAQSGITQDIDLPTGRIFSPVYWGGTFAARVSTLSPPSGFLSVAGSGSIAVKLTQLDAGGAVLADQMLVRAA